MTGNGLMISEEFLGQVELLALLIKDNVAGMFGGNHKSKSFGSSCEFSDYRDYVPGDDVTKIDWNAYARFEKLYLKLYLDERQLHTKIYIDVSGSMSYGKGKKHEQAVRLAATLAYLSVCEMDKVSIYAIRNGEVEDVILGMLGKEAYVGNIMKLNDLSFQGECKISEAMQKTSVGYGDGMSIIISDFLTDEDFDGAVDLLSGKRRDIFCIQVLSPEELNPKARGKLHYFDSENQNKFYRKNINRDIIAAYKLALEYVTGRVRDLCHSHGAEYMLVCSTESIGEVFFEKFASEGVVK